MIPFNNQITEITKFPISIVSPDDQFFDNIWLTYEEFVCKLVKERGTLDANLEHMVIGLCGEIGELADVIKKKTIYGKQLDVTNVIEELGDIEWYLAGLRQMLGLSRYQCLQGNVTKLQARYGASYSDAAAIARADKVETLEAGLDAVGSAITGIVSTPSRLFLVTSEPQQQEIRNGVPQAITMVDSSSAATSSVTTDLQSE